MIEGAEIIQEKRIVSDALANLQNYLFEVQTRFSQNGIVLDPEQSCRSGALVNYTRQARLHH